MPKKDLICNFLNGYGIPNAQRPTILKGLEHCPREKGLLF